MTQRTDLQDVLARLPDLLLAEEEQIREATGRAREMGRDLYLAGMSWADIGRLLGVSRQAARQRFGPAVEEWRATSPDEMPWEVWTGPLSAQAQLVSDSGWL